MDERRPRTHELAAVDELDVERLRRAAAEEHELAAGLEQRQGVGERGRRREQRAGEALALARAASKPSAAARRGAAGLGLEHAHVRAARAQRLRGEQADRAGARDERVAGQALDAAQHAAERLDERARRGR